MQNDDSCLNSLFVVWLVDGTAAHESCCLSVETRRDIFFHATICSSPKYFFSGVLFLLNQGTIIPSLQLHSTELKQPTPTSMSCLPTPFPVFSLRRFHGFRLFVRSSFISSHPYPFVMYCLVMRSGKATRTVHIIFYQYLRSQALFLPFFYSFLPFFSLCWFAMLFICCAIFFCCAIGLLCYWFVVVNYIAIAIYYLTSPTSFILTLLLQYLVFLG